jgi:hypothetical protein
MGRNGVGDEDSSPTIPYKEAKHDIAASKD